MYTYHIEWSTNVGYWQPTAATSFMLTPNFRHRHGYALGCHGHYPHPHSYPRVSLSWAIATYVALRGRCCRVIHVQVLVDLVFITSTTRRQRCRGDRVVAIATLLLSCPLRLRRPPPPPPPRRRRGDRYVVVVASLLLSHRPCPRPPRLRPQVRERVREREQGSDGTMRAIVRVVPPLPYPLANGGQGRARW